MKNKETLEEPAEVHKRAELHKKITYASNEELLLIQDIISKVQIPTFLKNEHGK